MPYKFTVAAIRRTSSLIALGAAFFVAAATAHTQATSSLPANAPTTLTPVGPLNATAAIPDAATRAHRAEVRFASGLLTVNANNSSLNQILREIARQTGMTISGGVRDDRVFGHYGPATPAELLETLLDGTGTNMLLQQTDANAPLALILSPRNGAATPPNINAPGFDDGDDPPQPQNTVAPLPRPTPPQPPQRQGPPPPIGYPGQAQAPLPDRTATPPSAGNLPTIAQPLNNVLGNPANTTPTASQLPTANSLPLDTLPTPTTTQPVAQGIVDSGNPPPAGNVYPVANAPGAITPDPNAAAPNTPKTPEQIFQQLQQMRQQQQKPPQ